MRFPRRRCGNDTGPVQDRPADSRDCVESIEKQRVGVYASLRLEHDIDVQSLDLNTFKSIADFEDCVKCLSLQTDLLVDLNLDLGADR